MSRGREVVWFSVMMPAAVLVVCGFVGGLCLSLFLAANGLGVEACLVTVATATVTYLMLLGVTDVLDRLTAWSYR